MSLTAPIHEAAQHGLAATLALTGTALGSFEKLSSLNLTAARSTLDDLSGAAQRVLAAKSLGEAQQILSSFAQPASDSASSYARTLFGIVSDSQREFAKAAESALTLANRELQSLLEAQSAAPAEARERPAKSRQPS